MKKILILLFTLFIVTSCNNEVTTNNVAEVGKTEVKGEVVTDSWNVENKEVNDVVEKVKAESSSIDEVKVKPDNTLALDSWVKYKDVKKNLEKLEGLNVDGMELEMINSQLKNIYTSHVKNEVKEKNDINLCDKLDSGELESCKTQFVISKWDSKECEILWNTWSVNKCKNTIITNQANSNLDEKVCDKLIDVTEEKSEINSCKDSIYLEKARKKSNIIFCTKITDEVSKNMCKDMVKIEKEQKAMEKEMHENIN